MLGKLIKYEFKGTYKLFGLLFGALILLALLSRFCIFVPFDNFIYDIFTGFITVAYVISVFCITLACTVIVMMRFNRHMYKDEAYLTHTLPVKPWQHIVAKLVTYTVWLIASVIMMLTSLLVYFVNTDEFDSILDFINEFFELIGENPVLIVSIILVLVVCIIQTMVTLLAYMSALSLGQIFRKHKIAGAVFFYFVLNNIVGTISSLIMSFPLVTKTMDNYVETMEKATEVADIAASVGGMINFMMIICLISLAICAALYFGITNYMLSKKLELE